MESGDFLISTLHASILNLAMWAVLRYDRREVKAMEFLPIYLMAVVAMLIVLAVIIIWVLNMPGPQRRPEIQIDTEYDSEGYNRQGYNAAGKNRQGRYNRIYNIKCYRKSDHSEEGFLDIREHPLFLTDHARHRMIQRLGLRTTAQMEKQALLAYQYGKSKLQLTKSQRAILEEKEAKHNCVMLLYKGYYYAFTENNGLKTVFENNTPWS